MPLEETGETSYNRAVPMGVLTDGSMFCPAYCRRSWNISYRTPPLFHSPSVQKAEGECFYPVADAENANDPVAFPEEYGMISLNLKVRGTSNVSRYYLGKYLICTGGISRIRCLWDSGTFQRERLI